MRSSRKGFMVAAVVAVVVSGNGCGLPPEPGAPAGAVIVAMQGLPAAPVVERHSGSRGFRRMVIRDSVTWLAFWDSLVFLTSPKPPAPAVNFAQDMVLAASLTKDSDFPPPTFAANIIGMDVLPDGANPYYAIGIEMVQEHGGDLWVSVREQKPDRTCPSLPPWTAPLMAVRVTRYDGRVTWIERGQLTRC